LSNVIVAQLDEALAVAPIASVQNRLSYGRPDDLPTALACARRGVSVHRILLAWLRAQSPNVVPLAGASRPASITDSAALLDLADEDLADLRAGC
jgi:diketogulonate reductase-like aldo/keto reductase